MPLLLFLPALFKLGPQSSGQRCAALLQLLPQLLQLCALPVGHVKGQRQKGLVGQLSS